MGERIDGKQVAADVREKVCAAVSKLPGQPTLAVVLVGEDAASEVYVRNKVRQTGGAGMRSLHHHLPADASQDDVETLISSLNGDDEVDGILLQLPLPQGLDEQRAIECIARQGCRWTARSQRWPLGARQGWPAPLYTHGLCDPGEIGAGRRPLGQECRRDRALDPGW